MGVLVVLCSGRVSTAHHATPRQATGKVNPYPLSLTYLDLHLLTFTLPLFLPSLKTCLSSLVSTFINHTHILTHVCLHFSVMLFSISQSPPSHNSLIPTYILHSQPSSLSHAIFNFESDFHLRFLSLYSSPPLSPHAVFNSISSSTPFFSPLHPTFFI